MLINLNTILISTLFCDWHRQGGHHRIDLYGKEIYPPTATMFSAPSDESNTSSFRGNLRILSSHEEVFLALPGPSNCIAVTNHHPPPQTLPLLQIILQLSWWVSHAFTLRMFVLLCLDRVSSIFEAKFCHDLINTVWVSIEDATYGVVDAFDIAAIKRQVR